MKGRQLRHWIASVLLLAGIGIGRAGDLAIESLGSDCGLVFRASEAGTTEHTYRVECTAALTSAAWTAVWTVGGVGPTAPVTNPVALPDRAAFYRVVATSNSASFVDGPYMVVDVSGGTDASNYPVSFYGSSADVPGGVRNDIYKTTSFLLRRIPAGTFIMGSPTGELGYQSDETHHQVTLTKDFYIGVFEVTQRQWERVMGNWPSYFSNTTYRDSRPVENVGYYDIRENPANSAISPHWPASARVHADSFIGKLRAKTGLTTLDLPTESQWEYACRAGTWAALNSGYDLTSTGSDPRMSEVGRYWYNGGSGQTQNGNTSVATATVGSYLANQWGLYDMHGNVLEWCLDWYGTYPGTVTDPVGAVSGVSRALRGGAWLNHAWLCRSAGRSYSRPDSRSRNDGFRLSMPLP